jgi:hypothetical protein
MRLEVPATVALVVASPALAAASPATCPVDADWILPGVALGGGASADVHVRVLVDEWAMDDASCPDRAVIVVHGAAHNAASWEPFAEALHFFTDHTGATIRGAPDLTTVARYNSAESGVAIEQILGVGAPELAPGLFDGERVRLTVLAHAGDPFARSERQRCLHRYLSSEPGDAGFVVMGGPGAIHDAHVSSPGDVARAVAGRAALP